MSEISQLQIEKNKRDSYVDLKKKSERELGAVADEWSAVRCCSNIPTR